MVKPQRRQWDDTPLVQWGQGDGRRALYDDDFAAMLGYPRAPRKVVTQRTTTILPDWRGRLVFGLWGCAIGVVATLVITQLGG